MSFYAMTVGVTEGRNGKSEEISNCVQKRKNFDLKWFFSSEDMSSKDLVFFYELAYENSIVCEIETMVDMIQ